MKKEKAILSFHCGEFGWELLRTAPHVLWTYRKKYNEEVKLIVCSRYDRYDLYGKDVDVFHPFENHQGSDKKQDCFKLFGFSDEDYYDHIKKLKQLYFEKYNIIETICPKIENRKYTQKNQFLQSEMDYNFKPRDDNNTVFNFLYKDNSERPIIVLAPRFREGVPRNWEHWQKFYDLIEPLKSKYKFIICGRTPDVIIDKKNRYQTAVHTRNEWDEDEQWSLVGLTIEIIKNAVLTIGSQSGVPNLSNILGTPTLQWGNEKNAHTKTYNINNTETIFLEDFDFNIEPKIVYDNMIDFLYKKMTKGE